MKVEVTLLVEYEQNGDLTDEQGRQIVAGLLLALESYGVLDDTSEAYIRSVSLTALKAQE